MPMADSTCHQAVRPLPRASVPAKRMFEPLSLTRLREVMSAPATVAPPALTDSTPTLSTPEIVTLDWAKARARQAGDRQSHYFLFHLFLPGKNATADPKGRLKRFYRTNTLGMRIIRNANYPVKHRMGQKYCRRISVV
jgi:hypothetical protein